MPDISVIIPVYNNEQYLEDCIKSVLFQTYSNIEVILVNDGSTDGSPQICDCYAKKDKRIKVIHTPHSGVSSARNIGIEKASGEYIAFIDSDDRVDSKSLENAHNIMVDTKADLVIWNYYYVEGQDVKRNEDFPESGVYNDDELINSLIASTMCPLICEIKTPNGLLLGMVYTWNKMFRNSVLQDHVIRFDEELSFCEDVVFVCRYLKHTKVVTFIDECNYFYRVVEDNTTSRLKSNLTDNNNRLMTELQKVLPEMTELQKAAYTARKIRCISDIAKFYYFHKDNIKKDAIGFLSVIKENKEYVDAIRETGYTYLTFKQKLIVMVLKFLVGNE